MSVESMKNLKSPIIKPKDMGLLVENPVYNHLDIHGVMMRG